MYKPYWIAILAITTALNSMAWCEEHQHSGSSIDHVEVTLPKNLLPGFPLVSGSLTMGDAVKVGIANNLGIQVAEAEVGVRHALLQEAKAKQWPVLSLGSLTFLRAGNNQVLMTPEIMMNTVDSTLFQDLNATGKMPLFTGGRIRGGIRMARLDVEGSEANVKQTMIEAAYQIKQVYLSALLSQAEHLVHQQHLKVQETLLKNTQARYTVGRGLRADVLRIQTEMADAQKMLNDEHIKLNNNIYELKAVMGIDLGSEIQLTDQLAFQPWAGPALPDLMQEAVKTHPKVIELEKQVQAAEAQIKVARSQYYPQVYGQVTGNLRLPSRPPIMGNGVIGMVTASLPVFDKNRGAEIAKAEAMLKKSQQALRAQQLDIGKLVAQAWSELEFRKANVALAEPTVTQAQEDLRLSQKRFDVGRGVIVEVQDAAWQLRQSQLNQADALYNYDLAKAKLLQAVGKITED